MRMRIPLSVAIVLAFTSGGCCHLHPDDPPGTLVGRWLGELPVGTPAADAKALLTRRGFGPIQDDVVSDSLRESRTGREAGIGPDVERILIARHHAGFCMLVGQFAVATIWIDDRGRVMNVSVKELWEGP